MSDGKLIISNRQVKDVLIELKERGYVQFAAKPNSKSPMKQDEESLLRAGYDYLLSSSLWSFTKEKLQELDALKELKYQQLQVLQTKTPKNLWLEDLMTLEEAIKTLYEVEDNDPEPEASSQPIPQKRSKRKSSTKKSSKKKTAVTKRRNSVPIENNEPINLENTEPNTVIHSKDIVKATEAEQLTNCKLQTPQKLIREVLSGVKRRLRPSGSTADLPVDNENENSGLVSNFSSKKAKLESNLVATTTNTLTTPASVVDLMEVINK